MNKILNVLLLISLFQCAGKNSNSVSLDTSSNENKINTDNAVSKDNALRSPAQLRTSGGTETSSTSSTSTSGSGSSSGGTTKGDGSGGVGPIGPGGDTNGDTGPGGEVETNPKIGVHFRPIPNLNSGEMCRQDLSKVSVYGVFGYPNILKGDSPGQGGFFQKLLSPQPPILPLPAFTQTDPIDPNHRNRSMNLRNV